MYAYEPQMRDGGTYHRKGGCVAAVEPFEKPVHLGRHGLRRRSSVMESFTAEHAGDHAHLSRTVCSYSKANGVGKKCRMPAEQTVGSQRDIVVVGGVEHHFYYAIYIMRRILAFRKRDAEFARHRTTHLIGIEAHALDLRRCHHIVGHRLDRGRHPAVEAYGRHPPGQISQAKHRPILQVVDIRIIPAKVRPIIMFVYKHSRISNMPYGYNSLLTIVLQK